MRRSNHGKGKDKTMTSFKFKYQGITGICERYKGGAYIWWGGMGFHFSAAIPALQRAILKYEPK
jgi:hypothetical protein